MLCVFISIHKCVAVGGVQVFVLAGLGGARVLIAALTLPPLFLCFSLGCRTSLISLDKYYDGGWGTQKRIRSLTLPSLKLVRLVNRLLKHKVGSIIKGHI